MKKLLTLLSLVFSLVSFGQLTQNFESGTFPPTGWTTFDNGVGTVNWNTTTSAALTYGGTGTSAFLTRVAGSAGVTAEEYLVTSQFTVPTNGQLRFYTRTTLAGNDGTSYSVRVSTTTQTGTAAFTTIPGATWDDSTLNTTYNQYEEKVLSLSAYAGQNIYLAFVRTNENADRWLIDNINVVQLCNSPTTLTSTNVGTTFATLGWTGPAGATQWEIEAIPQANPFTGAVTHVATSNPFTVTGLIQGTPYKFKVRAICPSGFPSDWSTTTGTFTTTIPGQACAAPIVVGALPYSTTDNTSNYGDTNDLTQPLACSGSATNYMAGNDVFYTYTPTVSGNIAIGLTPAGANSSIHVYNACPGTPGATCLAGVANTNSNPRNINPFAVTAGTTYYIIVSSSATSQTVGYTLTIQQVFCTQPSALTATNITTTSADLSWGNPSGATSWQVSVGLAPYGLPTGAGTTVNTNTGWTYNGVSGVVYQYYVRADCNDGNFSVWSGPYTFMLPQVPTNLNFSDGFETVTGWTLANISSTNVSQPNKWALGTAAANGGTHSIYISDTDGATNNYNVTGTSVVHAYKDFNIPAGAVQAELKFDWRSIGENANDYFRVWMVPTTFTPNPGTQITAGAGRVKVGIDFSSNTSWITQVYDAVNISSFAGSTMRLVFEWRNNNATGAQTPAAIDNVMLNLISCPKPSAVAANIIGYNYGVLSWTAGNTETQWEVITLPQGSPAPTAASTGTVVTTNPYTITGLTSVTCYDVYIRAICGTNDVSYWTGPYNFCTTPHFCAGDHFYDTGGASGAYNNNANVVTTICPDNAGDVVTVVFNSFNVAAGDNLVIRDGNLITSPILGTYTGTTLPPSFTATSASGCLTFVFTSNATGTAAGWDATIYCTPPITCPKPVTLSVLNVTSSSAQLSWTESGSATQWEVFVVPFGSNPPIYGQSGIPASSNPFTVNGLTPSTTYTFYVRAICSSTDASFWSDGFTFTTTPINDNCANATNALVNDDLNCTILNSGNLGGSTPSTVPALTACTPTANDVWYQFVATKSTHTMTLSNITAGNTVSFALYTGNCGAMTQVNCFTALTNVVNNLVIGQTYYIRVYTAGSTANTINFNLCIGSVPCPESVSLCSASITYPNATNVINLGSYGCLGSSPNASFFFLEAAQNGTLSYTMNQVNGSGTGIDVDYALWGPFATKDAGCIAIPNGTPVQCSYSTAATETFTVNALQGQVYILMVTNFANQAGSITITPNPSNTAQVFCYPYPTYNYSALYYCNNAANTTPTLIPGATAGTYTASPSGLNINSTTGEINFLASLPGTYTVTSTIIPNLAPPADNPPQICTRTVIVTPTPNATIAYSNPTYCNTDNQLHAVALTGNSGIGAYYSSTPVGLQNALDPNTGAITPVLAATGTYTITLTVPAQGGCPQYTTTTTVDIIAGPVIPAQVDVNGCNSYVLPALTIGNYYTGSGATGTPLNPGDVISSSQTIYVYATNGQCSSEDAFNVNIINIPTPVINITSQPTCAVQTGSIQVVAPVASGGTLPNNLFISEVTDANTGSLTYVELYNGTGAAVNLSGYKLRVYNNGAATTTCDNVLSGTIANNDTFVIKLSSDANIPGVTPDLILGTCSGVNNNDNIRLTTSANVVLDMWGPTDGSTFTPAGQPGYTYRRLASATPLPNPTWDSTQWTSLDPENYSNLGQYMLLTANYEYSVDNGTYQSNTIFTGLAPGTHTLIVHDIVNNCYSAPITFTIDAVPYTTPVVGFNYTTPVCQSSGTNPIPVLNVGFNTGGTFSSTNSGLVFVNSSTGEINLTASTAGTYQVDYTYAGDLTNCINPGTSSTTIVINVSTQATFTQIGPLCQNSSAPVLPATSTNNISGVWSPSVINTTTAGTTTYTFTPNAGECGTGTTMVVTVDASITPQFDPIGTICENSIAPTLPLTSINGISGTWNPSVVSTTASATYTFTPNAGQCATTTTLTVTVDNLDAPLFTQIEPLCTGTQAPELTTTSNNGITGTWNPSFIDTTIPGIQTLTFTPNAGECASTYVMNVAVENCTIQKGISPNGDGDNDYLQLKAEKVEIFNRYGKEVYSKVNYSNDWYGQSNGGSALPDGTYYYVIQLLGGELKTGWIYINKENK